MSELLNPRIYQELKQKAKKRDLLTRLENFKPLPSQSRLIEAYNDPAVSIIIFTGANQVGKSMIMTANLLATVHGFEPWSGRPRRFEPPVQIAILLDDYDNAANKWLNQNLSWFYPIHPSDGFLHIKRTQTGAPREVHFIKSLDGSRNGSVAHIFTQDQESRRAAGGTYHEFYVDEPQPKSHYMEVARGLQLHHGKTVMTMTPLSEPWIFDDVYNQGGNLGGSRNEIFSITAFPDENLKSHGGHLDDAAVAEFRASMTEEEREARIHGRWMHLIGRIYKTFDERVHVVDEVPDDVFQLGTHGLAVDPHDRLPFAMGRFVISPANDFYFFDEWPREPFEEIRHADHTIDFYADLIRGFDPQPFWRLMDPNFGLRKSVQSSFRGLTLADEFAVRKLPFMTRIIDDVATRHKAVQGLLAYDKERPIDALNRPKLLVTRNCRNIITSFRNYTWDDYRGKVGEGKEPKQKPREKYKHFMDLVGYAAVARISFVSRHEISKIRRSPDVFRPGWSTGSMPRQVRAFGGEPQTLHSVETEGFPLRHWEETWRR